VEKENIKRQMTIKNQKAKRSRFLFSFCSLISFCFLPFAFSLQGCGGERQTLKDDENGTKAKAPMVYYEATLRPSEFDEEVEIIQQAHEKQGESALPFEVPSDSTVVETVEVQGFRIQVFASSSIDDASAAQIVAREKVVTDSVYVVYDPPVYKVRVGDYATRLEANQRLPRLVHLGYTDAWVVSDKISLRRVTRIPRPAD
jgi:hypothetical protein